MKNPLVIILIPLFFFFFYGSTNGHSNIDSLEIALELEKDSKEKVDLLFELSGKLKYQDIDKSYAHALRAFHLSQNIDCEEGINKGYNALSEICWIKTEYDSAMYYALKFSESAIKADNKKNIARSYVLIGAIYSSIDYYSKSSEYYFKSLKISEEINDKRSTGLVLNNIGKVFSDQGNYEKAYDYFSLGLSIAEEVGDTIGIAAGLTNLASVFSNMKQFDKARVFTKKAIIISKISGMKPWLGTNYLNLGITNQEFKNYDSAIYYYQQAINVFEQAKDETFITQSYYNVAGYYLETGNHTKSIYYATRALEKGSEYGFKKAVFEAASILRRNYFDLHNSDSAYKYAMLQYSTNDSLNTEENYTKLSKLEMQFNFEKEQQQKLIQEQKKNFIIIIVFILMILLIVLVFSFAYRLRLKARNNLLEKQRVETELTSINKELTTNAMYLVKKNELLAGISEKLVEIEKDAVKDETKNAIHRIGRELQKSKDNDAWEEFELRFNQVHSNYYKKLKQQFPDLTPNDMRLCALLKLNMSTKEISEITGQRLGTIEMARSRIRKKLGITGTDTNLIDFLSGV